MNEEMAIQMLIVDDEEPDAIARGLETWCRQKQIPAFNTRTSKTLDEALSLLHEYAFHVAVVDLHMPNPYGEDRRAGFHFLKECEEHDRRRR